MAAKIFYKESVYKDLKTIDKKNRNKIINRINKGLSKTPPEGKTLSGEFKGLRSYRAVDYRVIYTKIPKGILVLRIGHRKDIYK